MPLCSGERESTRCVDVRSRLMSLPEAETHPAQSFIGHARASSLRERGDVALLPVCCAGCAFSGRFSVSAGMTSGAREGGFRLYETLGA
jgi:hypothetical protein